MYLSEPSKFRRKAAKAMPHGEAHPQAIVHENFCWATDSVTFPIDNLGGHSHSNFTSHESLSPTHSHSEPWLIPVK